MPHVLVNDGSSQAWLSGRANIGEVRQFLKESASQGLAGLVTLITPFLKFKFIPGFCKRQFACQNKEDRMNNLPNQ